MIEQTTLQNILTCVIAVILFIFQSLNYLITSIKIHVKHRGKITTIETEDSTISSDTKTNDNNVLEDCIRVQEIIKKHFDIPLKAAEDEPKVDDLIQSIQYSTSNICNKENEFVDYLIDDSYIARGLGLIAATVGRETEFYIYSKYDNDFKNIIIELKGRNGETGKTKISNLNCANDIEPQSIPIKYEYDQDRVKVIYIPYVTGVHTLTLSRNALSICRSPYYISVEKSPTNSRSRIRLGTKKYRMLTKFTKGKHTPVEYKENITPVIQPRKPTVKIDIHPMSEETYGGTDVMSIVTRFESKSKDIDRRLQKRMSSITERSPETDLIGENLTPSDMTSTIENDNINDNNICIKKNYVNINKTNSTFDHRPSIDTDKNQGKKNIVKVAENNEVTNEILQKNDVSLTHQKSINSVLVERLRHLSSYKEEENHNQTYNTNRMLEKQNNIKIPKDAINQLKISSVEDEVSYSDNDERKSNSLNKNVNELQSNDFIIQQITGSSPCNISNCFSNIVSEITNNVCENCSERVFRILSEIPRNLKKIHNKNFNEIGSNFETHLAQKIKTDINTDNTVSVSNEHNSTYLQITNSKNVEQENTIVKNIEFHSLDKLQSFDNNSEELGNDSIKNMNVESITEQNKYDAEISKIKEVNVMDTILTCPTENGKEKIDKEIYKKPLLSMNATTSQICTENEECDQSKNKIKLQAQITQKSTENNNIKIIEFNHYEKSKNHINTERDLTLGTNKSVTINNTGSNANETLKADKQKLINNEIISNENSNIQSSILNDTVLASIKLTLASAECKEFDSEQQTGDVCETDDQSLLLTTIQDVNQKLMIEKSIEPVLNIFKNNLVEQILQLYLKKDLKYLTNTNYTQSFENYKTKNESGETQLNNNAKCVDVVNKAKKQQINEILMAQVKSHTDKSEISETILHEEKTNDNHLLKNIKNIIKQNMTSNESRLATMVETKLHEIVNTAMHHPKNGQINDFSFAENSENNVCIQATKTCTPETSTPNTDKTIVKDESNDVELENINYNQILKDMEATSKETSATVTKENTPQILSNTEAITRNKPNVEKIENTPKIYFSGDTENISKKNTKEIIEIKTTSNVSKLNRSEFNTEEIETFSNAHKSDDTNPSIIKPISASEIVTITDTTMLNNTNETGVGTKLNSVDTKIISVASTSRDNENGILNERVSVNKENINKIIKSSNNVELNIVTSTPVSNDTKTRLLVAPNSNKLNTTIIKTPISSRIEDLNDIECLTMERINTRLEETSGDVNATDDTKSVTIEGETFFTLPLIDVAEIVVIERRKSEDIYSTNPGVLVSNRVATVTIKIETIPDTGLSNAILTVAVEKPNTVVIESTSKFPILSTSKAISFQKSNAVQIENTFKTKEESLKMKNATRQIETMSETTSLKVSDNKSMDKTITEKSEPATEIPVISQSKILTIIQPKTINNNTPSEIKLLNNLEDFSMSEKNVKEIEAISKESSSDYHESVKIEGSHMVETEKTIESIIENKTENLRVEELKAIEIVSMQETTISNNSYSEKLNVEKTNTIKTPMSTSDKFIAAEESKTVHTKIISNTSHLNDDKTITEDLSNASKKESIVLDKVIKDTTEIAYTIDVGKTSVEQTKIEDVNTTPKISILFDTTTIELTLETPVSINEESEVVFETNMINASPETSIGFDKVVENTTEIAYTIDGEKISVEQTKIVDANTTPTIPILCDTTTIELTPETPVLNKNNSVSVKETNKTKASPDTLTACDIIVEDNTEIPYTIEAELTSVVQSQMVDPNTTTPILCDTTTIALISETPVSNKEESEQVLETNMMKASPETSIVLDKVIKNTTEIAYTIDGEKISGEQTKILDVNTTPTIPILCEITTIELTPETPVSINEESEVVFETNIKNASPETSIGFDKVVENTTEIAYTIDVEKIPVEQTKIVDANTTPTTPILCDTTTIELTPETPVSFDAESKVVLETNMMNASPETSIVFDKVVENTTEIAYTIDEKKISVEQTKIIDANTTPTTPILCDTTTIELKPETPVLNKNNSVSVKETNKTKASPDTLTACDITVDNNTEIPYTIEAELTSVVQSQMVDPNTTTPILCDTTTIALISETPVSIKEESEQVLETNMMKASPETSIGFDKIVENTTEIAYTIDVGKTSVEQTKIVDVNTTPKISILCDTTTIELTLETPVSINEESEVVFETNMINASPETSIGFDKVVENTTEIAYTIDGEKISVEQTKIVDANTTPTTPILCDTTTIELTPETPVLNKNNSVSVKETNKTKASPDTLTACDIIVEDNTEIPYTIEAELTSVVQSQMVDPNTTTPILCDTTTIALISETPVSNKEESEQVLETNMMKASPETSIVLDKVIKNTTEIAYTIDVEKIPVEQTKIVDANTTPTTPILCDTTTIELTPETPVSFDAESKVVLETNMMNASPETSIVFDKVVENTTEIAYTIDEKKISVEQTKIIDANTTPTTPILCDTTTIELKPETPVLNKNNSVSVKETNKTKASPDTLTACDITVEDNTEIPYTIEAELTSVVQSQMVDPNTTIPILCDTTTLELTPETPVSINKEPEVVFETNMINASPETSIVFDKVVENTTEIAYTNDVVKISVEQTKIIDANTTPTTPILCDTTTIELTPETPVLNKNNSVSVRETNTTKASPDTLSPCDITVEGNTEIPYTIEAELTSVVQSQMVDPNTTTPILCDTTTIALISETPVSIKEESEQVLETNMMKASPETSIVLDKVIKNTTEIAYTIDGEKISGEQTKILDVNTSPTIPILCDTATIELIPETPVSINEESEVVLETNMKNASPETSIGFDKIVENTTEIAYTIDVGKTSVEQTKIVDVNTTPKISILCDTTTIELTLETPVSINEESEVVFETNMINASPETSIGFDKVVENTTEIAYTIDGEKISVEQTKIVDANTTPTTPILCDTTTIELKPETPVLNKNNSVSVKETNKTKDSPDTLTACDITVEDNTEIPYTIEAELTSVVQSQMVDPNTTTPILCDTTTLELTQETPVSINEEPEVVFETNMINVLHETSIVFDKVVENTTEITYTNDVVKISVEQTKIIDANTTPTTPILCDTTTIELTPETPVLNKNNSVSIRETSTTKASPDTLSPCDITVEDNTEIPYTIEAELTSVVQSQMVDPNTTTPILCDTTTIALISETPVSIKEESEQVLETNMMKASPETSIVLDKVIKNTTEIAYTIDGEKISGVQTKILDVNTSPTIPILCETATIELIPETPVSINEESEVVFETNIKNASPETSIGFDKVVQNTTEIAYTIDVEKIPVEQTKIVDANTTPTTPILCDTTTIELTPETPVLNKKNSVSVRETNITKASPDTLSACDITVDNNTEIPYTIEAELTSVVQSQMVDPNTTTPILCDTTTIALISETPVSIKEESEQVFETNMMKASPETSIVLDKVIKNTTEIAYTIDGEKISVEQTKIIDANTTPTTPILCDTTTIELTPETPVLNKNNSVSVKETNITKASPDTLTACDITVENNIEIPYTIEAELTSVVQSQMVDPNTTTPILCDTNTIALISETPVSIKEESEQVLETNMMKASPETSILLDKVIKNTTEIAYTIDGEKISGDQTKIIDANTKPTTPILCDTTTLELTPETPVSIKEESEVVLESNMKNASPETSIVFDKVVENTTEIAYTIDVVKISVEQTKILDVNTSHTIPILCDTATIELIPETPVSINEESEVVVETNMKNASPQTSIGFDKIVENTTEIAYAIDVEKIPVEQTKIVDANTTPTTPILCDTTTIELTPETPVSFEAESKVVLETNMMNASPETSIVFDKVVENTTEIAYTIDEKKISVEQTKITDANTTPTTPILYDTTTIELKPETPVLNKNNSVSVKETNKTKASPDTLTACDITVEDNTEIPYTIEAELTSVVQSQMVDPNTTTPILCDTTTIELTPETQVSIKEESEVVLETNMKNASPVTSIGFDKIVEITTDIAYTIDGEKISDEQTKFIDANTLPTTPILCDTTTIELTPRTPVSIKKESEIVLETNMINASPETLIASDKTAENTMEIPCKTEVVQTSIEEFNLVNDKTAIEISKEVSNIIETVVVEETKKDEKKNGSTNQIQCQTIVIEMNSEISNTTEMKEEEESKGVKVNTTPTITTTIFCDTSTTGMTSKSPISIEAELISLQEPKEVEIDPFSKTIISNETNAVVMTTEISIPIEAKPLSVKERNKIGTSSKTPTLWDNTVLENTTEIPCAIEAGKKPVVETKLVKIGPTSPISFGTTSIELTQETPVSIEVPSVTVEKVNNVEIDAVSITSISCDVTTVETSTEIVIPNNVKIEGESNRIEVITKPTTPIPGDTNSIELTPEPPFSNEGQPVTVEETKDVIDAISNVLSKSSSSNVSDESFVNSVNVNNRLFQVPIVSENETVTSEAIMVEKKRVSYVELPNITKPIPSDEILKSIVSTSNVSHLNISETVVVDRETTCEPNYEQKCVELDSINNSPIVKRNMFLVTDDLMYMKLDNTYDTLISNNSKSVSNERPDESRINKSERKIITVEEVDFECVDDNQIMETIREQENTEFETSKDSTTVTVGESFEIITKDTLETSDIESKLYDKFDDGILNLNNGCINIQTNSICDKDKTEKSDMSNTFFNYGETSKNLISENSNNSPEKSYGIQKWEMTVQCTKTSESDYFEKTYVQLEQTEKISLVNNTVEDENKTTFIDDKCYTVNESDLNAILCASSLQEALTLLDSKIKYKFKKNTRKASSNSSIYKSSMQTSTSTSTTKDKNTNFTEAQEFFKKIEQQSKK